MPKYGIDISEHNGQIDLKRQKVDFVMIRAGWSDQKDYLFDRNVKECQKLGIPFGVYWYSYALTPDAVKEEAIKCLNVISGLDIKVGVWFDMEDADHWKKNNGWDMSKHNISNICNTFCSMIESHGYYAGIYASYSWLTGSGQVIDCPKYDKWVAHYGVNNDGERHGDYSNIGSIHQYTSKVIDKDYMYGDISRYEVKKMKTFKEFYDKYNSKAVDDDGAYGVQCVDGFRVFCREFGVPVKPTPNNWADGYWYSKDALGYGSYFEYITGSSNFKDGDVVIWAKGSASHPNSHIAFYYKGKEFGQNQGGDRSFCLKDTNFKDALGALRLKIWSQKKSRWVKSENFWYYYKDGKKLTGWQKLKWSGGTNWFWFNAKGQMATGFKKLDWNGNYDWYYFDKHTGVMFTGEKEVIIRFGNSGKITDIKEV